MRGYQLVGLTVEAPSIVWKFVGVTVTPVWITPKTTIAFLLGTQHLTRNGSGHSMMGHEQAILY